MITKAKTLNKFIFIAVASFTSSVALAECPLDLPTKYLERCLVVEGSGSEYPTKQVMEILRDADMVISKAETTQDNYEVGL